MPDHADRLDPEFFAKVVGRDRSAAGGDQVQYDPLERLPVADTPGDDQVAADDPVVQPQHRPGPACLNGFGQRAARHVVGDGLRTSFFVREFEKFVVGERFEPSRDEEAGYPVRPHVLLDAEQGGQRDGGDDLDALRGLFAQERQPAGRAVHFVQQQDAFARVADQAVELGEIRFVESGQSRIVEIGVPCFRVLVFQHSAEERRSTASPHAADQQGTVGKIGERTGYFPGVARRHVVERLALFRYDVFDGGFRKHRLFFSAKVRIYILKTKNSFFY